MICVGPLLVLPFVPQTRWTSVPIAVVAPIGLLAVACAFVVWCLAFRAIGFIPSIRPPKGLVDTGPYGVVRNPIYLGILMGTLGLSLAFRALDALYYWPVILCCFGAITFLEEKGLKAEYGEAYSAYKKKVRHRLIPYVF
jgi:protein-S-isoprenylcysteine O-methyltransferase Ste14